jgi:N-acetylglucosamine kinase-like BadF-type ATPase
VPTYPTIVAVDAGRTSCRAAAVTTTAGGQLVLGDRVALPSRANVVDPGGPAEVAATIQQAVAGLGGSESILVVAAAGALSRPAAIALAERLAGSFAEVAVTSDVVAAHAAAFGGGSGVVLAVGTGAVALAVRADGRHILVDGRGYLLGDAGGGFSIGRAGLVAALRHGDGRTGGSAVLASAAVARFGPLDQLPYVLQGAADAPRQIASFVPEVAEAARAGDPVAQSIWREAAAELAETVAAAGGAGPDGDCRVALVGSLSEVDDLLVAPLRASLATRCPAALVDAESPEILAGVATLARPVPAYEALIVRRR